MRKARDFILISRPIIVSIIEWDQLGNHSDAALIKCIESLSYFSLLFICFSNFHPTKLFIIPIHPFSDMTLYRRAENDNQNIES